MRDFITRGGAISVDHLAEPHAAADDLGGTHGEPVSGPATHVHAGGGNGAQRAPEGLGGRFVCTSDDAWRMAIAQLDAIHAQANALASAEPSVPIAGSEPWEESEIAYYRRLIDRVWDFEARAAFNVGRLDELGRKRALPRARLVGAEAP